jgi:DNA-binding CsgD family transcriptional regulator
MTADFERSNASAASEAVGLIRTGVLLEMARVAVYSGDPERAEEYLVATRNDRAAGRLQDAIAWTEALIRSAQGRPAEAAEAIERGIAAADGRSVIARYRQLGWDIVRIAADAGRHDLAEHATGRIEEIARRSEVRSVEALALQCRGFLEGDIGLCRNAVSAFRETRHVHDLGRALETQGRLALGTGDNREVADSLGEAIRIYESCPAASDAARARAFLRTIGVRVIGRRPRARATTGWDALTPAEREVVRLVAEGLTNGQIAERLFVSKRTVETHIWRGYAKLGAGSRVELARVALAAMAANDADGAAAANP